MELEQYNFSVEEKEENGLKELLIKYVFNWKWFLVSLIVFLFLGFVYLRFQPPLYEVNASILIKDDAKGSSISDEVSAFQDLGLFKSKSNIDNEIEILKSRFLMTRVVNELKLNVQYYSKGRPIEHERYFDTPIIANYTITDSTIALEGNWVLVPESKEKFTLNNGEGEIIGDYKFGEEVKTSFGKITFNVTNYFNQNFINQNFRVVISPINKVIDNYISAINIAPVNKTSNAITISLRDPLPNKAAAIVDNLIKQHYLDAIADKNQVSKNTADFINERIKYITNELSQVEGEVETFKTEHKLTDVKSDAALFIQTGSESEVSLLEAMTQMHISDFMYEYILKHDAQLDLIPSNLGLSDISVSNQIDGYNKLLLDRNRILKNSSEKNPIIENYDNQLIGLKSSIKESLNNLRTSLQIKVKELDKQESNISSKIATVPKYEREFRIIERQQQIKETLYLYLLQKREETNLALAVSVANAKVIDKAYSDGQMVAPKKLIIYEIAFLLGMIIPIVILYIMNLLDTKVHGKKDIDKVNIPFLGDVPLSEEKSFLVVSDRDRSNISEAFRLLRTNVEFINSVVKKKNKTVFITSTISKEGKSFVSLNLAASIALSGKKTLLVGTDLRDPKLLKYLNLKDKKGITNFVTDPSFKIEDVIFPVEGRPNFFVLPSGPIPPNPAELLMNPRIKEMFEIIQEEYEYVIVDTAPVGMVADTLLISHYGDCTVFVARANFLDKKMLRIAETLNKEKRLPNMAVLINGTDYTKGRGYYYGYGYGYGGYGYGYGREVEALTPWYRKIFRKG